MRTLFHLWLSPASRKVRLALHEKALTFSLRIEKTWERRPEYLQFNPTGEVPLLVEADGAAFSDGQVICEYLEETYTGTNLIGHHPVARAETRRLVAWFDTKFRNEVSDWLIEEKVMKRLTRQGTPNAGAIRAASANLHTHLDYIGWLTERRNWLGGDDFTLADITAAAHLSAIDYLGDIPWEKHPEAKEWYSRIKSRPSFRPLLADAVQGIPPAPHYADLDF